jgi:metallo-beta-lactamase family protein
MRIQFCGADRTVTGSSHLLEINGLRVFLDMGMYQGPREEARRINQYLPADVRTADAIILSHGHLDHCGKLPVVTRAGFKGPIYCTPATAEVARIVLNDSAAIQLEDVNYMSRHDLPNNDKPQEPLYTPKDIPAVLNLMKKIPYGQKTEIGKGVSFTFHDAGHILGSAYVVLEWNEAGRNRNLLFTADIGRYDTPILRDPEKLPGPMDQVITESTYGDTEHAAMGLIGPQFLDAVKFCIQRKSRLLIPSFAVGRTQTVLWYIQKFIREKQIPEIPIFVDSPMGVAISKVHSMFPECYDDETREMLGKSDLFGMSHVTFTASSDDSKKINSQQGPCVIIASSPTCEFGRILHHLKQSASRADDLVVFVGWIPPQTLGRRLQDGQKHVRMFDQWFDVKFQVRTIHGLSAHAGCDELLRLLGPTLKKETTAWVVHGEVDQAEGFARRLMGAGIGRATIPAMESSVIDDVTGGGVSEMSGKLTVEQGE